MGSGFACVTYIIAKIKTCGYAGQFWSKSFLYKTWWEGLAILQSQFIDYDEGFDESAAWLF